MSAGDGCAAFCATGAPDFAPPWAAIPTISRVSCECSTPTGGTRKAFLSNELGKAPSCTGGAVLPAPTRSPSCRATAGRQSIMLGGQSAPGRIGVHLGHIESDGPVLGHQQLLAAPFELHALDAQLGDLLPAFVGAAFQAQPARLGTRAGTTHLLSTAGVAAIRLPARGRKSQISNAPPRPPAWVHVPAVSAAPAVVAEDIGLGHLVMAIVPSVQGAEGHKFDEKDRTVPCCLRDLPGRGPVAISHPIPSRACPSSSLRTWRRRL